MSLCARVFGCFAVIAILALCMRWGHGSQPRPRKSPAQSAGTESAQRQRKANTEQVKESQESEPLLAGQPPGIAAKPPFPKFSIDEAVFDFGTAHVGQVMTHTFEIQNVGRAPLVLVTATRCGKEGGGGGFYRWGWRKVLRVGERFDYQVEWKGREPNNNFAAGVHLLTNDPQHPDVYFKVLGRIIDPPWPKFVRENVDIP
jgi:hypothetical protein